MINIFSIDVEDWFHILELDSTPDVNKWENLPSRVVTNFPKMLDIFDKAGVKVTCFFLGWIAEKHPKLVKLACNRGHEVASHGYTHQLIYTQTRQEFSRDIQKTKKIIEDITGTAVNGYRAPGFSITRDTMWALEELSMAGYKYDSSIFPAQRGHGYILGADLFPHKISLNGHEILEFPITVANIFNKKICFFGGGYLRLFPYFIIRRMTVKVNKEDRPVIYYIHPREIDAHQPRLTMGTGRRFKSYVNLRSTEKKLKKITGSDNLTTFTDWMNKHKNVFSTDG
ncbi:polysaccharide deacetylase family protein [candidate division KSB1 bacterium]|nr:polysaccharide deacetylase family protein [candidate division KSB1 bacterium]